YIKIFYIEILPHPPYSPDLSPNEFHFFRSLKISSQKDDLGSRRLLKTSFSSIFLLETRIFIYVKFCNTLAKVYRTFWKLFQIKLFNFNVMMFSN
ncbi:hypothetical protein WH47_08438, partial [Habropoda laboriosa]